ncbi:MAG: pyruvate formate lyase-activating protein [Bdellovibrionales bacterium]|nr:pyruvate formate lyase-activating protein [Bdellovibrionales bacterium]
MSVKGRIHSVETCGTVDGPGVRYLVFMQGCSLRCLYCHNPDTRHPHEGREVTAEELFREIWRYRTYFEKSGGGVTFTGGEPLLQPDFIGDLAEACRDANIHTALDTSGFNFQRDSKQSWAVDSVDLVLLDIKAFDPKTYRKVTGVKLGPTLNMLEYLEEIGKKTWVRFVLVPGLTDSVDEVTSLANIISHKKNIAKVQVLPFHKMGEYKWKQMGFKYELDKTLPPSREQLTSVQEIFRRFGLETE